MSTDRHLIFDAGPDETCGCRWQLWIEDSALHVGAACEQCHLQILEVIQLKWPGLEVKVVY